jgi:hypothetical protein
MDWWQKLLLALENGGISLHKINLAGNVLTVMVVTQLMNKLSIDRYGAFFGTHKDTILPA